MDWQTIITNVITSSALIGIIGYILRQSFNRLLDVKIKELEERSKVYINELNRRQAIVFDQQLGTLRVALSLVYRARNIAREIMTTLADKQREGPPAHEVVDNGHLQTLFSYQVAIQDLLYTERALLPNTIFGVLHTLKSSLGQFAGGVSCYRQSRHTSQGQIRDSEHLENLKESYFQLNHGYESLVDLVQKHLLVSKETT